MSKNRAIYTLLMVITSCSFAMGQDGDLSLTMYRMDRLRQSSDNTYDKLPFVQNYNYIDLALACNWKRKDKNIMSVQVGYYFHDWKLNNPDYSGYVLNSNEGRQRRNRAYVKVGLAKQMQLNKFVFRGQMYCPVSYSFGGISDTYQSYDDTLTKRTLERDFMHVRYADEIGLGVGVNLTVLYPLCKRLYLHVGFNVEETLSITVQNTSQDIVVEDLQGGSLGRNEHITYHVKGTTKFDFNYFPSIGLTYMLR